MGTYFFFLNCPRKTIIADSEWYSRMITTFFSSAIQANEVHRKQLLHWRLLVSAGCMYVVREEDQHTSVFKLHDNRLHNPCLHRSRCYWTTCPCMHLAFFHIIFAGAVDLRKERRWSFKSCVRALFLLFSQATVILEVTQMHALGIPS